MTKVTDQSKLLKDHIKWHIFYFLANLARFTLLEILVNELNILTLM